MLDEPLEQNAISPLYLPYISSHLPYISAHLEVLDEALEERGEAEAQLATRVRAGAERVARVVHGQAR